jgi:hypothetical protein
VLTLSVTSEQYRQLDHARGRLSPVRVRVRVRVRVCSPVASLLGRSYEHAHTNADLRHRSSDYLIIMSILFDSDSYCILVIIIMMIIICICV